jgi:2-polyprenyl-3-methyl-5-hydroxy-6-metoxy-1,4-benzoquinol methylase
LLDTLRIFIAERSHIRTRILDVVTKRMSKWEALARREPYFPLLDADAGAEVVASNRIATAAFFETGEADLASLLAAIESILGQPVAPIASLDFGCGAGRLTLPLARRSMRVVACDVSPAMLAQVEQNARRAGLSNVTCIEPDTLPTQREGTFDLVCSLLVFQYIPPVEGYAIIRSLLRLLAPNGIAALQVTLERKGAPLRRLARFTRSLASPHMTRRPQERPTSPDIRLNEYNEPRLAQIASDAGAEIIALFPTTQDGAAGAVFVMRKLAHEDAGGE